MFIVLPPCLPRCTATRLSGMQQQEITGRVEFLFESAAGRGLRNRPYTAIRQAKITMVRPNPPRDASARNTRRRPFDHRRSARGHLQWAPASSALAPHAIDRVCKTVVTVDFASNSLVTS